MYLQNSTDRTIIVKLSNPKFSKHTKPGEIIYVGKDYLSRLSVETQEMVVDGDVEILTQPPFQGYPLGFRTLGVVEVEDSLSIDTHRSLLSEGMEVVPTGYRGEEALKRESPKDNNTFLVLVRDGEVLEPGTGFMLSKAFFQGANRVVFKDIEKGNRVVAVRAGVGLKERIDHLKAYFPHPGPPKPFRSFWTPKTVRVLFPSRGRPKELRKTIDEWRKNCYSPKSVYMTVSVDSDDPKLSEYKKLLENVNNVVLHVGEHKGVNSAVHSALKSTDEDVVVVAADDIESFESWDLRVRHRLRGKPGRGLVTWDGYAPVNYEVPSVYIASRGLIDDWGYVLWPEYHKVWGENDFFERLLLEKRCVWALDLLFSHKSHRFIQVNNDSTSKAISLQENYDKGLDIYRKRKARAFDEPLPF